MMCWKAAAEPRKSPWRKSTRAALTATASACSTAGACPQSVSPINAAVSRVRRVITRKERICSRILAARDFGNRRDHGFAAARNPEAPLRRLITTDRNSLYLRGGNLNLHALGAADIVHGGDHGGFAQR